MAQPEDLKPFASRLLGQDSPPSDAQYKEYRMKLDLALDLSRRREVIVGRIAVVSFVVSLTLMFVGGSRVIGDFDPWSRQATPLSILAGLVYVLATITCALSLASYFSRFRPATRAAEERLRDAAIADLQRQLHELRHLPQEAPPQ